MEKIAQRGATYFALITRYHKVDQIMENYARERREI
jgi:hypothetical protein